MTKNSSDIGLKFTDQFATKVNSQRQVDTSEILSFAKLQSPILYTWNLSGLWSTRLSFLTSSLDVASM